MSIINLLPEEYLKQRWRRRVNSICLVLFAVVMAGVVGAVVVSQQSLQRTIEVRNRVEASYADAARMIEEMQGLEQQKRLLIQKAETTTSLMERVPRSCLLAIITNALPENTSLLTFHLDTKRIVTRDQAGQAGAVRKLPRDGAAPTSTVVIDITGVASTDVEVARFIATTARNPLIVSVDLVYSQEKVSEGKTMREFQVKIEVRANVDAIDAVRAASDTTAAAPAEKPEAHT